MPEKQSKRSKVTLNILTIFQLAVDLISVCIFIARFEGGEGHAGELVAKIEFTKL